MAVNILSLPALASFSILLFRHTPTYAFVYPLFIKVPRSPGHGQIFHSSVNSIGHVATSDNVITDEHRRHLLGLAMVMSHIFIGGIFPKSASADDTQLISSIHGIYDVRLRNYFNPNFPNWKGTSLDVISLEDAAQRISMQSNPKPTLPMGRWPDPILRRPAASIPSTVFQSSTQLQHLQSVAMALKNTARKEGAVGLAAQQCGVNASLIFIDGVSERRRLDKIVGVHYSKDPVNEVLGEGERLSNVREYLRRDSGIFLVNPRIIQRSIESDMRVWTEECLVLPPEFRATLLRDAKVTIEYESLGYNPEDCGQTRQITLSGELARCAQHEMDHDRGVLIIDHVGLSELLYVGEDMFMANIENADGLHESRMESAYTRDISKSILLPTSENAVSLAVENSGCMRSRVTEIDYSCEVTTDKWFLQSANAMDGSPLPQSEGSREPNAPQTTTENMGNAVTQECDAKCLERRRIIESRRALMNQSRSNTNRGDVLKLSEQSFV
ncbi:hypothetical protein HJC23_003057 [Cyclotella cryptica]|uniref:Peptide deformylase n=1 Tax=Cyclotella cryptica TaxID=29204 RepID=A0ABD3PZL6_9STRA|eukprot:CCRYP_010226-RB/>CCRYP_010226-RB protein AED:0.01 eAED:0.01 QI:127/-1/1/1/-1/1/1/177/498